MDNKKYEAMVLRVAVKKHLIKHVLGGDDRGLMKVDHPASIYLAKLFGYPDYDQLIDVSEVDSSIRAKLRLLLGPHCHTLCKTMEARQG